MAAVVWAITLVVVPAAAPRLGLGILLAPINAIGSVICHQRPERSFHLGGIQLPVCARCVGLYLGAAFGGVFALPRTRMSWWRLVSGARLWIALAALPTILTLLFESVSGITPSNWSRFAAGVPLGAAIAWVLVAASGSNRAVEVH